MNKSVENLLQKALIAEQAERFQDMVQAMKNLSENKGVLTNDERYMLSFAFKKLVSLRRESWRAINMAEEKVQEDSRKLTITKEYKEQIADDIRELCQQILKLLKETLIPKSKDAEDKVFYLTMRGDYYRYLSEIASKKEKEPLIVNITKSYKEGYDLSKKKLPPTDPTRLGLMLNYSVFFYETLHSANKAISTAKAAYEGSNDKLASLPDNSSKGETIKIMESIRKNIYVWAGITDENQENTSKNEKNEEEK